MNFILLFGVLSSVFVSMIYGQYYPHRTPVSKQPFMYSASASPKANPFQRAYENQGYYQRFKDYGNRRVKPLTQPKQSYNTYSDNKGKAGKGQQKQDNYEDNTEYEYEPNLDYNDVTEGKNFDPFKFINDHFSSGNDYGDFGGLTDFGQHFDYNN